MASDSRTNAGYDQVNVSRKMHVFVRNDERVLVVLTSGSLSCTQSILTLLRRDYDDGKGLAAVDSIYEAARVGGEQVRKVAELDREALERDEFQFNVHLIVGGQVKGQPPELFLVYPQGNPLQANEDSCYLQIGETKYGRPILDRGLRYHDTSLEEAAKYALLSLDSTMKSNVTVGPPIDLLAYANDELDITRFRRFEADDAALAKIRTRWDQNIRQAVSKLPAIRFAHGSSDAVRSGAQEETIQVIENSNGDATS
jgi:putative proteasome-type protease